MGTKLYQVGVDHHLAPIDVREQIALDGEGATAVAKAINAESWASEVVLVSTCNRTELYVTSDEPAGAELALDALLRHLPEAPEAGSGCYRQQTGMSAVEYLLRVSCGLESAIVGETEIQGQVRDAHLRGHDSRTIGAYLERLFQTATRIGKRARTETAISSGGISHGKAAAKVVDRIFGELKGQQVLVVGAGIMARQSARAIAELGDASFVIVNRTPANAEELAAELRQAEVHGLDALESTLATSQIAVLATGAEPMKAATVAQAVRRRRDPLLLVDLGVPRCVEVEVKDLPGVFLYDLEALERMVASAVSHRLEAVPAVEALIREELTEFQAWSKGRGAAPAIHSMNAWAESIRKAEMRWLPDDLSDEDRAAVEKLTKRLVKRLLGRAAARVVKGAGGDNPDLPTPEDLRSVFGLEEGENR